MKSCYCETVRNITVTIPDDVYRRARVRAAENDTSVSAIVRDFLSRLADATEDFERGQALQDEVLAQVKAFRAGDRLSRDAVHDRDALR